VLRPAATHEYREGAAGTTVVLSRLDCIIVLGHAHMCVHCLISAIAGAGIIQLGHTVVAAAAAAAAAAGKFTHHNGSSVCTVPPSAA
jgi:hypothetical protein